MKLKSEQKTEIFKMLAYKPSYEVGLEFGLDKFYKNKRAVMNKVYQAYMQVKEKPEEYGIELSTVDLVLKAMGARAIEGRNTAIETPKDVDIQTTVLKIRDKSFGLIDKKLDRVSKSRKQLDATSFKDLGVIAGISFDKGQILRGEATENIAIQAKIDKNISPDDALDMMMKIREEIVAKKNA